MKTKKFGNHYAKKKAIKEAVKDGNRTKEEISKYLTEQGYSSNSISPGKLGMFIYHNMGGELDTVHEGRILREARKNSYYLKGEAQIKKQCPKRERRKIGDIALEVMEEETITFIGYSTLGMLDEVFSRGVKEGIIKEIGSRGGTRRPHPKNRHQVILNSLDRDKRFKKDLVRCTDGRSEVLTRSFRFIPNTKREGD